jgi:alpha-beta hydrolase superfamily lysophospholipase
MMEVNDTNKIISPPRSPLRKFFRWLKIFIIIYCGAGILLYNFQDKFLLHPVAVQPGYHYKISGPFEEINIPINKDENLNVIRFTTNSKPKGAVLYFHGNMMNVSHYAGHALNFTRKGYEVWMPDYPGYGKTTGVISEKKLYDEALLVYKLANTKFPKDSIVIFGKSLGSGIAAQLASIKDCRRLILETPYYSIPSVFGYYVPFYPVSFMSHFKIPTATYLQQVTAPVTIFHGSKDEVIPYKNSLRLRKVLKEGDEFISIPGGKHNDLSTFTIYQQKMDSLLRD